MIAAIESISEFVRSKIETSLVLAGLTTPEMRFSQRLSQQAPEFPNCLNLYFFDHMNSGGVQFNPAWRDLTASFELLVELDADRPLYSEAQTLRVMHKINEFMAVQTTTKMDYSVTPPVSLRSGISWRDSYPLEWRSAANASDRYIHKTAFLTFRYFEQPLVVA